MIPIPDLSELRLRWIHYRWIIFELTNYLTIAVWRIESWVAVHTVEWRCTFAAVRTRVPARYTFS